MNIGIDARMFGPRVGGGGLGRYVEQLVTQLQATDDTNRYVLFLKKENADACRLTNPRFEKRVADIHWYTLAEQVSLAPIIDREELDLVHFPHWNVPLGLKTPFVVTIHDLILLEEPRSARATTRNQLVYRLKYAAFRRVLAHAVRKSRRIIAVSAYTRDSILKHFPDVDPQKITVVYEGVTALPASPSNAPKPSAPYFLHVGNAYPHKNLESLLHAFSFFHLAHPDVTLVIAGRRDVFFKCLEREADEIGIPRANLRFVADPSDVKIAELYRNASLYLFPSRIEGFGLPALEAMQEGVPVAAANTSSLPEILGDAAVYFAPDDIEEMVAVMERALADEPLRASLRQKGRERAGRYSWKRAAEETRRVYELA
jgi:glycosyltransferase involved in cell wall biosynthesis